MSNPEAPLFGFRKKLSDGSFEVKYSWYSAKKIYGSAEKLGSGMRNLGLIEKINEWNNMDMEFVGMYSINTVRLLTADISCGIYNYCIIPIYDTLGEESIELALKQTKLKTCLVSFSNLKKMMKAKEKGLYSTL